MLDRGELVSHLSARVIVVGGGILGTMHAVFAIKTGATVVHIDRHREPRGASVRNFGLVLVSGRAAGPELALALRARELWEMVGRDVPATGFRPTGSITVVSSEAELQVLTAAVARGDADERGLSLIDAIEARRRNPGLKGQFLAGLHCSKDAAVEPRQLLGALREWLAASGRYEYLAPREVLDIRDREVLDSSGVSHRGDLVVLCLGALSSGPLLPLFAGADLQAVRLQMAQTEPLGRDLTTCVADGNTLRYYPAHSDLAARLLGPKDEELARFGIQLLCLQRLDGSLTLGDTHEYEQPFAFELSDQAIDLVAELARKVVGPPFPRIRRRWSGIYHQLAQPSAEKLYLRREVAPGVLAVTGAGGRGMTLAPAIAQDTFA
jgi:FAD dependent oxidoreductase TIGR03364